MSELALKLIDKNIITRSHFLDLGNCELTEIPSEIGQLSWIEELSFSDSWVDEGHIEKTTNNGLANNIGSLNPVDNPLGKLPNLTKLWINGGTHIEYNLRNLGSLTNLNNLNVLDLSYSKVVDIKPLYMLKNLNILNLSNTLVSDINPLNNLINLESLYLSNTKVSDLEPINKLANIKWLNLAKTPISDLTMLADLEKLEWLDVSATNVSDLIPIKASNNLRWLYLSDTNIQDISPLSELALLEELHAVNLHIIDLQPLSLLNNLMVIDLSNSDIKDLSPLINLIRNGLPIITKSSHRKENGIYVENCNLSIPTPDIISEGKDLILSQLKQYKNKPENFDQLFEAKLLIVGEGGSGKTSLLRRLYQTHKPLPTQSESTKGIDIYKHIINSKNGKEFRLNVWDFGGQEIYHATHQFFLTKRSLYILLDDTIKGNRCVYDEGFKYWLEVVDQFSDHSPVLIFQNEKGNRSKPIDETGIKEHFNNVKDVYHGNLTNPKAADKLRDAIEFYAGNLPHVGGELPKAWLSIRSEIESLAISKPFITLNEYFDLYSKHLTFDREEALQLSRIFHDIGVFLHFKDDLYLLNTIILQNQWATEAVYKILDDEIIKNALGHFTSQDYERIWNDLIYDGKYPELLALMQRFELCYLLPDVKPQTWLATQLLPPSKPSDLTNWECPGDLVLRYCYKFMPNGLINRLMVRMNRYIQQPNLCWVNGVLFEIKGSQVLVEIPFRYWEIVLRGRGLDCKELITVIAADLDALNDSFNLLNEKVIKLVPCNCSRCRDTQIPKFYEYEILNKRNRDGRLTIECPDSYENVNVLALLDGKKGYQQPEFPNYDEITPTNPKKIFISYSKHDNEYKNALLRHLSGLRERIVTWNDHDILPGENWDDRIKKELSRADIVIYLVTNHSMDTDYIQSIELPLVEQRCNNKECILVPIIVDFCNWHNLDFAKYNALPTKGEPITSRMWTNENEAWYTVICEIERIIKT